MRSVTIKTITLLTLIIGLLFSNVVQAEQLTLDDCIDLALKNRASIVAVRGELTRSNDNKRAALGAFLPGINTSYSYTKSKTTDLEIGDISFGDQEDRSDKFLSISANMWGINIPSWFNYIGSKVDQEKARLNVLNSELDLIYAVKTSYYAYLASVENVEVQKEAVKRSEEQLKLIESRFELGSAAKSDVLKQKVQFGRDRLTLLSGENAVTNSKAALAYTIGVDPKSDVSFSPKYIESIYNGTMDEALSYAFQNTPFLLSAKKEVDASKYGLKSRKAEYLPKLSLNASYRHSEGIGPQSYGDPTLITSSSNSRSYGFQISWNIFDGFSRERNISSAKIKLNNARANYSDSKNWLVKDIKTAFLDIERLQEQKTVSQENVDASVEDLRITQEKYDLGAATILDLLNAQVSLKEAQVSLIKAEFDLNLAVAKIEKSMGKIYN